MTILSPITQKSNVLLEKGIDTKYLISKYQSTYNIDVSKYFDSIDRILIYKCIESGYRFYHPYNISGNGDFYEYFQKFEWYYMPWKWEHQIADRFIKSSMKILEIGCGNGDFLKHIRNEKGVQGVGLELNQLAEENGRKNGIKIINETIEIHSIKNESSYDVVCAFQVLEHISDVHSFLKSSIKCLKNGGILIISVPNNDSFLKNSENILNMPPHHMGLWNKKSLLSLKRYFPINKEHVFLEPLQIYHKDYFKQTLIQFLHKRFKLPIKSASFFYPLFFLFASKNFKAFTIQILYRKNEIA